MFRRLLILYIFIAYFLVSMLLTWPLITQLNLTLFGDFGDTRGVIWGIWAKINGYLDTPFNYLTTFPYGVPNIAYISTPISEWFVYILANLTNEIVSYNTFILLSLPLTAISTYFLLNRLLHNQISAIFGGLVFGFCPAAVMQITGGHAAFAFNVFIPLFVLALFYNRSRRTMLSLFCVSVCFTGATFTAIYLGYFAIYIGIFFVAFDLLNSKNINKFSILKNYSYAAFLAAVLILPFEYRAIYQQLALGNSALVKTGQIRNLSELMVYSSRPWDYLIPSIDHPIIGGIFQDFVRTHLHGSNVPEQTLYLGLAPILLLLIGFVLIFQKRFNAVNRSYFLFFSFGSLWMYFLSLPPQISVGDFNIPTISFYAYLIAPMFRVYARFGIFVNFFIACAAAVVLTQLYIHMIRVRYYAMVTLLFSILIFEYWSIPPGYALQVANPPEVYRWLANEPKDAVVAIYPMTPGDQYAFYTYLFWQRIHQKKMVNGALPNNEKAWDFFEKVKKIDNPLTPSLLKSIGVTHVIVHTKMFPEGPIPEPIKKYYSLQDSSLVFDGGNMPTIPLSLNLKKNFGSDLVFSINENPIVPTEKSISESAKGAQK